MTDDGFGALMCKKCAQSRRLGLGLGGVGEPRTGIIGSFMTLSLSLSVYMYIYLCMYSSIVYCSMIYYDPWFAEAATGNHRESLPKAKGGGCFPSSIVQYRIGYFRIV